MPSEFPKRLATEEETRDVVAMLEREVADAETREDEWKTLSFKRKLLEGHRRFLAEFVAAREPDARQFRPLCEHFAALPHPWGRLMLLCLSGSSVVHSAQVLNLTATQVISMRARVRDELEHALRSPTREVAS
jgi:hypothetical protein